MTTLEVKIRGDPRHEFTPLSELELLNVCSKNWEKLKAFWKTWSYYMLLHVNVCVVLFFWRGLLQFLLLKCHMLLQELTRASSHITRSNTPSCEILCLWIFGNKLTNQVTEEFLKKDQHFDKFQGSSVEDRFADWWKAAGWREAIGSHWQGAGRKAIDTRNESSLVNYAFPGFLVYVEFPVWTHHVKARVARSKYVSMCFSPDWFANLQPLAKLQTWVGIGLPRIQGSPDSRMLSVDITEWFDRFHLSAKSINYQTNAIDVYFSVCFLHFDPSTQDIT